MTLVLNAQLVQAPLDLMQVQLEKLEHLVVCLPIWTNLLLFQIFEQQKEPVDLAQAPTLSALLHFHLPQSPA